MTIQDLCIKNGHYKIEAGGSINTRCPTCGDSQKIGHTRNYGQAYIYPDGFSKCFRCGEYATAVEFIERIFDKLNIPIDPQLLEQFKTKEIQYIYNFTKGEYKDMCEGEFNYYPNKIEYISNRFGKELTYEDAINYKFVFDIYKYDDVIRKKYRKIPNYDEYIAYVSSHNKKLILRAIDPNNKFKHLKIDLVNDQDASDYWAPADYSSKLIKSKKLILAEGIFTVNNSFIENQFGDNLAISASMSKLNLIKTIKYIYYENISKFDLILLRDKDVDKRFIWFLFNCCKKYINSISVYSNSMDSDFNSNKIILSQDMYRKI